MRSSMNKLFWSVGLTVLCACTSCANIDDEPGETESEFLHLIVNPNTEFAPSPNVEEMVAVYPYPIPSTPPLTFSVYLQSEDAGKDVKAVLLVDYGHMSKGGSPYSAGFPAKTLPAGSWVDGPREVTAEWNPLGVQPGCHTVTLIVTHEFKETPADYWCPVDPDDFDMITWFVAVCDEEGGYCDCEPDQDEHAYCEWP